MLIFGSQKANEIRKQDKQIETEITEARIAGIDKDLPVKCWHVSVEVMRDDFHLIDARTEDEAIALCEKKYDGDPYEAHEIKENRHSRKEAQHDKQT